MLNGKIAKLTEIPTVKATRLPEPHEHFIVRFMGTEPTLRTIIYNNGEYLMIDLLEGRITNFSTSIEALLDSGVYSDITIVELEEVKFTKKQL